MTLALPLAWVARTSNRKTGDMPTGYVGRTVADCWASCEGCVLREGPCYAWLGLARASLAQIEKRISEDPDRYSLDVALENRSPSARAGRIGAMGDPARANPVEVLKACGRLTDEGLAVIGYTHFPREADHLRGICLASCEFPDDAREALDLGWTPSVLLPWDWLVDHGKTFELPGGGLGRVCPAQTNPGRVTCNDCLICWLGHPFWRAGRFRAIGFVDHSKAALREACRWQHGRQISLFDRRPDTRPRAR